MGEIVISDRLITLIYNAKSVREKQALAYAKAARNAIREINISKTKLAGTQIADKLKIKIQDLANQDHPAYIKKFKQHDFSENDWIKVIQHLPEIMKQPLL